MNIKTSQDNKIAEYAEECPSDIVTCLDNNNFDLNLQTGTTLSATNRIAVKACAAQIRTCMSVNGETPTSGSFSDGEMFKWAIDVAQESATSTFATYKNNCEETGGTYSVSENGMHSCDCSSAQDTTLQNNGMCIKDSVIENCELGGRWDSSTASCTCDGYSKLVDEKCVFDKTLAAAKCATFTTQATCTAATQQSLCDASESTGITSGGSYCQYDSTANKCSLADSICSGS